MRIEAKGQPAALVLVFATICVMSAMALVYTKHESRKLFVELERLCRMKARRTEHRVGATADRAEHLGNSCPNRAGGERPTCPLMRPESDEIFVIERP